MRLRAAPRASAAALALVPLAGCVALTPSASVSLSGERTTSVRLDRARPAQAAPAVATEGAGSDAEAPTAR